MFVLCIGYFAYCTRTALHANTKAVASASVRSVAQHHSALYSHLFSLPTSLQHQHRVAYDDGTSFWVSAENAQGNHSEALRACGSILSLGPQLDLARCSLFSSTNRRECEVERCACSLGMSTLEVRKMGSTRLARMCDSEDHTPIRNGNVEGIGRRSERASDRRETNRQRNTPRGANHGSIFDAVSAVTLGYIAVVNAALSLRLCKSPKGVDGNGFARRVGFGIVS